MKNEFSRWRLALGLSLTDVAKTLGMSYSRVRDYEHMKEGDEKLSHVMRLAMSAIKSSYLPFYGKDGIPTDDPTSYTVIGKFRMLRSFQPSVYVFHTASSPEKNLLKVGWTSRPDVRIVELREAGLPKINFPYTIRGEYICLEMFGDVERAKAAEKACHKALREYKYRPPGYNPKVDLLEWFIADPEKTVDTVRNICDHYRFSR